ncbi:MAG: hypothetical protein RLZZ242_511 [Bacteroidota bacterium]|jgi:pyrroline-5-carboxylate reductase
MESISIIGAGNLGQSIATGLLKNGHQLTLSRRKISALSAWANHDNVTLTSSNTEAVQGAAVIILAVQPRHLQSVLSEIAPVLEPSQVVVSTAAGYGLERLEELLPKDQPLLRAMPNTAVSVQASMTTLSANMAGRAHIDAVSAVFDCVGETLVIDEEQMQAATVLCASGIAFWLRLIRANTQGGVEMGFESDTALKMATQTAYGAAQLLLSSGHHPEAEIDRVTTPKGCTITGLNVMEHQGMSSAFIQGLTASFEKINELKKQ